MLDIPEYVLKEISEGRVDIDLIVHFPNGEHSDLTNENIVSESAEFSESLCSQEELKFGLCESSVFKFKTFDIENLTGVEIEVKYKIKLLKDVIIDEKYVEYTSDSIGQIINMKTSLVVEYKGIATLRTEEPDCYLQEIGFEEHFYPDTWESAGSDSFPADTVRTTTYDLSSLHNMRISYAYISKPRSKLYVDIIEYAKNEYEIPMGTFIIDECKKDHSDISLRNVVAYSKDVRYDYPDCLKSIIDSVGYGSSDMPSLYYDDIQKMIFQDELYEELKSDIKSLHNSTKKRTFQQTAIKAYTQAQSGKNIAIQKDIRSVCLPCYDVNNNAIWYSEIHIEHGGGLVYFYVTNDRKLVIGKRELKSSDILNLYSHENGDTLAEFIEKYSDDKSFNLYRFVANPVIPGTAIGSINIGDEAETTTIKITGKIPEINPQMYNTMGFVKTRNNYMFMDCIENNAYYMLDFLDKFSDSSYIKVTDNKLNNGIVVDNINDFIYPFTKLKILNGYNYEEGRKIVVEQGEIQLTTKIEQPLSFTEIDYYKKGEYVPFFIPSIKNMHEYVNNSFYAYSYFSRPFYLYEPDDTYIGSFEPPVFWTPYLIQVYSREGFLIAELDASKYMTPDDEDSEPWYPDINYMYRKLSTNGMKINLFPKGSKTVEQIKIDFENKNFYKSFLNYNTVQLPNSREYIEGLFELQGKFGKIGRDGKLKEYTLGSNIVYPSQDTIPSENLFPGSYDANVDSILYTMNDYSSLWYEDELTPMYNSVFCEYTDLDGNKLKATYYLSVPVGTKVRQYDLSNNYLIKNNRYSVSEINKLLGDFISAIKDIRYMPIELNCKGFPQVEAGDMAIILTENETVSTFILRRTLSGIKALTDSIESN